MDKEPSLEFNRLFFLISGIAGFFLARKHPAFLFLVSPIVFMFASLLLGEINDRNVGKDIIREAGYGYVLQSYIAVFIGTVLPALGTFVWIRRRRGKTPA